MFFAIRSGARNLRALLKMRISILALLLLPLSGCRHKPPYVEPPPTWRWADVGKSCTTDAPATELPISARDSLGYPFGTPGAQDHWEEQASVSQDSGRMGRSS